MIPYTTQRFYDQLDVYIWIIILLVIAMVGYVRGMTDGSVPSVSS
jgi:hypothetical protein